MRTEPPERRNQKRQGHGPADHLAVEPGVARVEVRGDGKEEEQRRGDVDRDRFGIQPPVDFFARRHL
eukprot:CAMPEP_0183298002 /NCGR_PEP_ID=MMETSP0160_2-20130417/5142_1 /TAXON_ID=2839 ORGANISM="Odontella Sinensis, Strain Grunow 1884" /NCGR_SAMPLE_ID=MMETSP0160_2 /ASSEMBLY_ACC=CAM_ASM_000250 /LENGTH=66 /DNA_ID=CAMNT_0025459931 /DNA_START=457 /DNA_END=657 /DNA_ORIENTATION=-